MEKLENILEALLFVSGQAVDINDIAAKTDATKKQIMAAAENLKQKYSGDSGIHILIFNNKLQFCSNPGYAFVVEAVLNPIKERELSKAMLEVCSIIAYKQPITRLEIEEIRGVNCDYALSMLLKHNIIEVVGRKDALGKPLLYGTTDEFLKRFQISSLDELPDYEEVLGRIKVLNLVDTSKNLFQTQNNGQNGEQTAEQAQDQNTEQNGGDAASEN